MEDPAYDNKIFLIQSHLGDCYTTSHNLGAFTAGEEKRIEGRCAVAVCSASGDISLRGCGVRRAAYPIRVLPGDLSKPYPRCCHRIVGPNNDTDSDNERPRNTGNVVLAGAFLNPMLSR
ncbi:uncharacterized protein LOC114331456 isoform X5 [Diabrotica virgifera virgifera]|uniref:Single domain-containing protein n=1 Tax=Diabrotica virgifera virgifera TaxID=50390 RepID=A0ABM5JW42_DIAVI|nr:uncharacterized protein LOC114331456 isoform X5 [Diabrotica virgifera virgifera]